MPPPQPGASSPCGRSSAQLSAVQQAQTWIAQQQHRRKLLQQQPQQQPQQQQQLEQGSSPLTALSDSATDISGAGKPTSRAASVFPETHLVSSTLRGDSPDEPNQALEARSNSTDAIMDAQLRTMAFLAPQDPNHPPWGPAGDTADGVEVPPPGTLARQPSPLTSPNPSGWGQGRVQARESSAGVPAAPSSSSGRQPPSPGSVKLPASSAPASSSSWGSPMQGGREGQLAGAPNSERLQPQALLDAVKVQSQPSYLAAGGDGWGLMGVLCTGGFAQEPTPECHVHSKAQIFIKMSMLSAYQAHVLPCTAAFCSHSSGCGSQCSRSCQCSRSSQRSYHYIESHKQVQAPRVARRCAQLQPQKLCCVIATIGDPLPPQPPPPSIPTPTPAPTPQKNVLSVEGRPACRRRVRWTSWESRSCYSSRHQLFRSSCHCSTQLSRRRRRSWRLQMGLTHGHRKSAVATRMHVCSHVLKPQENGCFALQPLLDWFNQHCRLHKSTHHCTFADWYICGRLLAVQH